MKLKQKMQQALRRRFDAWLDKRQPAAQQVTLKQQLLFVFPTAYGGWCLLLMALLYLFGSNYQNNLILLCAYMLLSLFCFCILAAFFNLHHLTLQSHAVPFGYAGTALHLTLPLSHTENKKMIGFSSDDFEPLFFELLPTQLHLELFPESRGFYQLRRFKLQSSYPFGLIRCWTHVQLQQTYWVYPEPAPLPETALPSGLQQPDSPDQLAPYQPGDPASALDWKRLAKNPWQPVIRQYSQSAVSPQHTELKVTATGAALELQLSEFCALLLQFEQQGLNYSLVTPTKALGPDKGHSHLHQCLQALALC